MSKKNNGGPAFPTMYDDGYNMIADGMQTRTVAIVKTESGMTLRDWFAGQALTGMMADSERSVNIYTNSGGDDEAMAEINAAWAYFMADAMLKERDK